MRIDAASEERLEAWIDARAAGRFLDERVEAEARQVAVVEHDRMPQIDGALVIRVLGQHREELARPDAVARVPRQRALTVQSHPLIRGRGRAGGGGGGRGAGAARGAAGRETGK